MALTTSQIYNVLSARSQKERIKSAVPSRGGSKRNSVSKMKHAMTQESASNVLDFLRLESPEQISIHSDEKLSKFKGSHYTSNTHTRNTRHTNNELTKNTMSGDTPLNFNPERIKSAKTQIRSSYSRKIKNIKNT